MTLHTLQPGTEGHGRDATLREYYAARVPEYGALYQKPERQQELRLLERWVPTVFAGRRVLEVAAGTGYWTRFIAPQATSLLATDATAQALALASKRVISGKVRFALADAYALPAELGRFDAAFAGFWLSHVPKSRLADFFAGLHARLEPGAKVLLLDNRFVAGSNHPVSEVDAEGNTYQMRRLQNGSVHKVLKNFPSGDELLAMIAGLGVVGTVLHQWQYFWALAYEIGYPPSA
jgi:demethylmenaquinone methyltransferase/2-methoxy-6-polyprenyl-1,4-benzoquinol methylase